MLRIGFVDHHLNNFHANKFLSLLRGPLADQGVEVALAWESDRTGDDWCEANGVARGASAAEVARAVDAVIVLAPDNIEAHPALAAEVLPAGKPTVIDKFLAPTVREAREIVSLAKAHGAPVFSSSALRFAVELEAAVGDQQPGDCPAAFARGMGSWSGYAVHTVAMIQRIMGVGVRRLINTGRQDANTVTLDYGGDRRAAVDVREGSNMWEQLNWMFAARSGDAYVGSAITDYDGFYANLMRRAVRFFQSGQPEISPEEAIEMVAVLEGAEVSRQQGGVWIELSQ